MNTVLAILCSFWLTSLLWFVWALTRSIRGGGRVVR
jgi:hypothetical protein